MAQRLTGAAGAAGATGATGVTDDAWQARVTIEAAEAIGAWLEARGRLHRPIGGLARSDLEAIATVAISRFVVMASERIADHPAESEDLRVLLLA